MADYKIKENILEKPVKQQDLLWEEHGHLKYKISKNNHPDVPFKKQFDITKLKQAQERIKKEIISSNLENSPVIYTAIPNKTNE